MQSHRLKSRIGNPSQRRAPSFAWPAAGLVAAFALGTAAEAQAQSLDSAGVNAKVKAIVDPFKSANGGALVTSGFAFAVVYPSTNNGLITSTLWYGHAPTATGVEALGPHTLFEVGSVTKTVTATLLAKVRDRQPSFAHPSGGLWMSPSDMIHWLEYNTGHVDLTVTHPDLAYAVHLLQTQIVASQGGATEQGGGLGQGLAWEFGKLSTADRTGQRAYRFKGGFSPDYEQPTMVCIDDATGVGVAVMANFTRANGERPTDDLCEKVLESLSGTN